MAFSKVIMNGNTLVDLTQDTVISDALRTGFTAHKNDGTVITGAFGGSNSVIFLDYDGSFVSSRSKAEINAMTSDADLPANPSHEGLIAQGWNWTVAQLKAQLTAMPNDVVYVGQMYTTESGASEIDVEFYEGRLSPILTLAVNGTVTVDWGDNTTPDTVTGSSLTTRLAVGPHNYASEGFYTISVKESTGSKYDFYCQSSYAILRKNTSTNSNFVYSSAVKDIRLGSGIQNLLSAPFINCYSLATITIPNTIESIGANAFANCRSLYAVTIPNSVTSISATSFSGANSLTTVLLPGTITSIGENAFTYDYVLQTILLPHTVTSIGQKILTYCYTLYNITIPPNITGLSGTFNGCYTIKYISLPSGLTTIGNYTFNACYALESIEIPSTVTTINSYAFASCYTLCSITIPNNTTSISDYAFQKCYSLASITIPSNVSSIGNNAFDQCYGAKEYHIKPSTPPTLGTDVFNDIQSDCVIYVPRGKLSTYQNATGWSEYANYMQEESA